MLPEVEYSFDLASGKLIYGISCKKSWKEGIITLCLKHSGVQRLYTIRTGAEIKVDYSSYWPRVFGRLKRKPGNLFYRLHLDDGDIVGKTAPQ